MSRDEMSREELFDHEFFTGMRDWEPPRRPLGQRIAILLGKVVVGVWGLASLLVQLGVLALLLVGLYFAIRWVIGIL